MISIELFTLSWIHESGMQNTSAMETKNAKISPTYTLMNGFNCFTLPIFSYSVLPHNLCLQIW